MVYSNEFKEFVEFGVLNNIFLGTGNPNSKILIVGKEVAIPTENDSDPFITKNIKINKNNAKDWKLNIDSNKSLNEIEDWNFDEYMTNENPTNNPLHIFKGVLVKHHKEGQTWRKYQKLHDLIFEGKINPITDKRFNFQENFFITELNDAPNKNSYSADKSSIDGRIKIFKDSAFIQQFPVIILACSNYIKNYGEDETRQIDNTFAVEYRKTVITNAKQQFWVHLNNDKTKLVIHTRQLSANTSNELLRSLSKTIQIFLSQSKF